MQNNQEKLPILILRDMVLFPGSELRLEFDTLVEKQILTTDIQNGI